MVQRCAGGDEAARRQPDRGGNAEPLRGNLRAYLRHHLCPRRRGRDRHIRRLFLDLSKTGDLVCSTGSSAGILFYGDTITYPDNTVEQVAYSILPYSVFEGGTKTAIQRGGGLMVASNEEKKEYAAAVFIKWLTASEQNMRFISSTGYLPVTRQAFETDMDAHIASVEDARIKKMLVAVTSMYREYRFFTPPNFAAFDDIGKEYEKRFKTLLASRREAYLDGGDTGTETALAEIRK